MSLLIVRGLEKHYGAEEVLAGAELRVEPGEKIGVVGRNGSGKSTLLRLIAGEETADRGSIDLRKGARTGHVAQSPDFGAGRTVRDWVRAGLAEVEQRIADLQRVAERMEGAEESELRRLMAEHQSLEERIEALGGWNSERRIETVLSGLGVGRELWEREARTLSGGERSRVALAGELVAGHDLLLLDEPTNHLDLDGIEWIEAWLAQLAGAALIVSHDRRLLDNTVDAIVEVERGRLRRSPGGYSRYVALRAERHEAEQRAWQAQQDHVRREEAFIARHMGSQRTAEARGRRRRLEGLERLPKPHLDVRAPVIRPPRAERGGELVLEARNLAAGFPERELFSGVELRVGRGDRLGIIGHNGAGKTTLLRILAGRAQPLEGTIEHGHRAVCGWFDQDTPGDLGQGTVMEEVRRGHPHLIEQAARDHLARFLFRGNDVDKPVASLSGGERSRLALARLVMEQPSWLALDEPTNHLDLPARTALEEMLGDFPGAILCVSHDRALLDGLCQGILEVAEGSIRRHAGNYAAWRRERQEAVHAREASATRRAPAGAAAERRRGKVIDGRVRNPWMFEKLEERIIELEGELGDLQSELALEEVYRDADALRDRQTRIAEVEQALAEANERWEHWDD